VPNEARADRLRLLAAELGSELERVGRLVAEFDHAAAALDDPARDVLIVYGAAALLESFYTGMEKALQRIASTLGGMPGGGAWHRDLLASMALTLRGIRPAVLSEATVAAIDPYLAFRHRFRNLYVFDLEPAPMCTLLKHGADAHQAFAADLEAFAARLDAWAIELGEG